LHDCHVGRRTEHQGRGQGSFPFGRRGRIDFDNVRAFIARIFDQAFQPLEIPRIGD
jgi:hypothetical protein